MKIGSLIVPGYSRLAKIPDLSRQARQRVKWFDYYESRGRNARLTCRYFGISPQTFYRWKGRYDTGNVKTLEDRSHRPRHLREPTASPELVQAVLETREEWPRWGKEKLARLLNGEGYHTSVSMVGRILKRLKDRGVLKEPMLNYVSARKRERHRPYGVRKPKDYIVKMPGDIVQVDTVDLRPLPGVIVKQFTARDTVSKWDVLEAHSRATSQAAAGFIEAVVTRMPFPVKAFQVDGGSEFQDAFEAECQKRGIGLFVLPPRSPKLNGHVERAQRTHIEEFYEVTDSSFEIAELNPALLRWEKVYNTFRPHQALGYMTPKQFLDQLNEEKKGVMCH